MKKVIFRSYETTSQSLAALGALAEFDNLIRDRLEDGGDVITLAEVEQYRNLEAKLRREQTITEHMLEKHVE